MPGSWTKITYSFLLYHSLISLGTRGSEVGRHLGKIPSASEHKVTGGDVVLE